MMCMDARQSLGVYVIGSLPVYEAVEVREHLEFCPQCRVEYDELAGLPRMLGMISVEEAAFGPVQANDEILHRLLDQVAAERRGQTRRHRALSAVAAIVLVIGGGALWAGVPGLNGRTADPTPHTVVATSQTTGVKASILYGPKASGTWTNLRLWNVPPGERCRLVVVGRDGKRQVASGWQSGDGGPTEVSTDVAMPTESIARFEIVNQEGEPMVVATL
jgi:hypothetical protein